MVEVGEVAPPSVDGAALPCGDDLLRIHHGQRRAAQRDRPAEKPGNLHGAWRGPDRIADVDLSFALARVAVRVMRTPLYSSSCRVTSAAAVSVSVSRRVHHRGSRR